MGCVFKNNFSVINVSGRGMPFVKIGGSPNCPPGTSQIRNSRPKTAVITFDYHSLDGHLEIIFYVFFTNQSFVFPLKSILW